MLVFPGLDAGDLERIVGVTLHLLHDRYDDERRDCVTCREFINGRVFRYPVCRRIELRAELVGPQRIFRRFEAVLLVRIDLPLPGKSFEIGSLSCIGRTYPLTDVTTAAV